MSGYRMYAEQYIKPRLGNKKMNSITPADIRRLYAKLMKEGRVREHPEHGRFLSAGTIRRIHTMLHRALGDAVKAHIIPRNPAEGLTLPKSDCLAKYVLTDKELDKFMEVIKADPFWHDFFYTELTTGLRRGEICGLQWCDFDPETGMLQISRTLHKKGGWRVRDRRSENRAGTAQNPTPAEYSGYAPGAQEAFPGKWIFPNPLKPEQPVAPDMAYRRFKALLHEAGIAENIPFHGLRHTFATHALASGVDAKTLSGILGHTDVTFTLNMCTHVTGDMQKQASVIVGNFMEDIFGKKLKPWQNAESGAEEAFI